MSQKDKTQVVVCRFDSDITAHIAQGMLENHGIVSMLTNETIAGVLGIPTASFCAICLWVNAEDAERAIELLRTTGDIEG